MCSSALKLKDKYRASSVVNLFVFLHENCMASEIVTVSFEC